MKNKNIVLLALVLATSKAYAAAPEGSSAASMQQQLEKLWAERPATTQSPVTEVDMYKSLKLNRVDQSESMARRGIRISLFNFKSHLSSPQDQVKAFHASDRPALFAVLRSNKTVISGLTDIIPSVVQPIEGRLTAKVQKEAASQAVQEAERLAKRTNFQKAKEAIAGVVISSGRFISDFFYAPVVLTGTVAAGVALTNHAKVTDINLSHVVAGSFTLGSLASAFYYFDKKRDARAQTEKLAKDCEQQSAKYERAKLVIACDERRIESLSQDISKYKGVIESVVSRIESLSTGISELTQKREQLSEDIASLTQKKEQLAEDTVKLANQHNQLDQTMIPALVDRQAKLAKGIAAMEQKGMSLLEEITYQLDQRTAVESEVKKSLQRKQELATLVARLTQEHDNLNQVLLDSQTSLDELNAGKQASSNALAILRGDIQNETFNLQQLHEQLLKAQDKLTATRVELAQLADFRNGILTALRILSNSPHDANQVLEIQRASKPVPPLVAQLTAIAGSAFHKTSDDMFRLTTVERTNQDIVEQFFAAAAAAGSTAQSKTGDETYDSKRFQELSDNDDNIDDQSSASDEDTTESGHDTSSDSGDGGALKQVLHLLDEEKNNNNQ